MAAAARDYQSNPETFFSWNFCTQPRPPFWNVTLIKKRNSRDYNLWLALIKKKFLKYRLCWWDFDFIGYLNVIDYLIDFYSLYYLCLRASSVQVMRRKKCRSENHISILNLINWRLQEKENEIYRLCYVFNRKLQAAKCKQSLPSHGTPLYLWLVELFRCWCVRYFE